MATVLAAIYKFLVSGPRRRRKETEEVSAEFVSENTGRFSLVPEILVSCETIKGQLSEQHNLLEQTTRVQDKLLESLHQTDMRIGAFEKEMSHLSEAIRELAREIRSFAKQRS